MRWSSLIPKRHWSGRYLVDRARLELWQRRHPDAPWMPAPAVEFLAGWLRESDRVIELGAGRSTAWLARRVGEVISVEHDRAWRERVVAELEATGVDNARVLEAPEGSAEAYLAPLEALGFGAGLGAVDLVLVDGRWRDRAALWALEHVAAGGLVVVDDAERYLPSRARGPEAIGPDAEPVSEAWGAFAAGIAERRCVWFEDGVTATLVVWV